MRTAILMLATAASLGTAAIASAPASAQYYGGYGYDHRGYHHDRWDRHDDYRRWHHERERDWRSNHDYGRHGYNGYYGRGYYGY